MMCRKDCIYCMRQWGTNSYVFNCRGAHVAFTQYTHSMTAICLCISDQSSGELDKHIVSNIQLISVNLLQSDTSASGCSVILDFTKPESWAERVQIRKFFRLRLGLQCDYHTTKSHHGTPVDFLSTFYLALQIYFSMTT